jgi:hypothetical protein
VSAWNADGSPRDPFIAELARLHGVINGRREIWDTRLLVPRNDAEAGTMFANIRARAEREAQ